MAILISLIHVRLKRIFIPLRHGESS
uniref:Uncharacterized protein n=1 Tax=Arundo donax TaxID=35708 RepID=A0A0A9G433_ARUDO